MPAIATWKPMMPYTATLAPRSSGNSYGGQTYGTAVSFDAAIQEGLRRANQTLRGITGLHVIEQKAKVTDGQIEEYRATMEITFVLEG